MAQGYGDLITAIIRMQMRIIGGGIALRIAESVKGLVVDESGNVISYPDDPIVTIRELIEQYRKVERGVALTLAKKSIKPILEKNPELQIPDELR